MLDTDQLRSFLAIVDTGSFTRASERVHKTQSAVSMHIKKLEERLGRALFDKQGRGVRLSEDGEKLVDYARRMLQIEASAIAAISQKGLTGHVRLGIPDDYADSFLPAILKQFTRRHPLVEVSVVCDFSRRARRASFVRAPRHGGGDGLRAHRQCRDPARGAAELGRGPALLGACGAAFAARARPPEL